MNRFYIITNSEKDKELKTTGEIYEYLKARGCECIVREYQGKGEPPDVISNTRMNPGFPKGRNVFWCLAATAL